LSPARSTIGEGKVEVVEFFSYGCPHCADFHPIVTKWAASLPKDATFIRVPVSFGRPQWGQLVRAYYAFEAMGELKRFDEPLFNAIHREHKPLYTEESLAAWVAQNGGDAAKFREAFNSFSVSQKSMRIEQLTRDYQVSGVPLVTVNGKYSVVGQTFDDVVRIATELVEKERAAAKANKQQE
jgi:protein dithiol oxidoreductase (disulfide-forming)